jgi:putative lipoic acid-binding regulatory protein
MDVAKFKELLDSTYQWPDYYDFKFIVKAEQKEQLESLLEGYTISENPSKQGNYVSVTARKLIKETQEVIDTYEKVGSIKGIMSL